MVLSTKVAFFSLINVGSSFHCIYFFSCVCVLYVYVFMCVCACVCVHSHTVCVRMYFRACVFVYMHAC